MEITTDNPCVQIVFPVSINLDLGEWELKHVCSTEKLALKRYRELQGKYPKKKYPNRELSIDPCGVDE